MKLHLQRNTSVNIVRAYGPGHVQVNDTTCDASLVLGADLLVPDWPVRHATQLDAASLLPLLEYAPEILLVGTGARHRLLDPAISIAITQRGVGIEIMSTEAACRTYNVLLGEDRRVIAALIVEADQGAG